MTRTCTVLGGGPVGLAAALALAQTEGSENVRLVEAGGLARRPPQDAATDIRVYALSPATRRLMESLQVWQALRQDRLTPVYRMEVHGDAPDGLLELGLREPLAWIVEHGELAGALAEAVRDRGIEVLENAQARRWTAPAADGQPSLLQLADREVEQAVIIGADGAQSWLRGQAGWTAQSKDYDALGVVANFGCRIAHRQVARQWFKGSGVLAWLPLPGDRISIVWSLPRVEAEALCARPIAEIAREVSLAGSGREDVLTAESRVAAFPLRRILAPVAADAGILLIGDAAHAIHPLAGQGVNLGFGDVACLQRSFLQRSALHAPGDRARLRAIERERREDVLALAVLTDRLQALYRSSSGTLGRLRNAGLAWVNRQDAVKHAIMRAAMG